MRPKYLYECKYCGFVTDSTIGINSSCPARAHVDATHVYEEVINE